MDIQYELNGTTFRWDAAIGYDGQGRLLYVVHIEVEGEFIRIVSARKATVKERELYDF
jgi:uncharacterized DUF497 family protein